MQQINIPYEELLRIYFSLHTFYVYRVSQSQLAQRRRLASSSMDTWVLIKFYQKNSIKEIIITL